MSKPVKTPLVTKFNAWVLHIQEYNDNTVINDETSIIQDDDTGAKIIKKKYNSIMEQIRKDTTIRSYQGNYSDNWLEITCLSEVDGTESLYRVKAFLVEIKNDDYPIEKYPYKIINIHSEDGIVIENEKYCGDVYLTSLKNLYKEFRYLIGSLEDNIMTTKGVSLINTSYGLTSAKVEYIKILSTEKHISEEFRVVKR